MERNVFIFPFVADSADASIQIALLLPKLIIQIKFNIVRYELWRG